MTSELVKRISAAMWWTGNDEVCYTGLDDIEALEATVTRQARTIRRLFTAYFLAKGQVKNVNACLAFALERHTRLQADVHNNVIPDSVLAGVDQERARIVAALRFEADAAAKMPGEVWAGVAAAMAGAANYIERGDHTLPGRP